MKTKLYTKEQIPMKIAVFASGTGTNFEHLYNKQVEYKEKGNINYGEICIVFSNNPDSQVLDKAENLGIEAVSLSSAKYFDILGKSPTDESLRETYDLAVLTLIEQHIKPDLIVLAGYRRKLSRFFYDRYKNKIINLYPGDITKTYLVRGKPAYYQAAKSGENCIRCTCYIESNPDERFGTAIAQSAEISFDEYNIDKDGKKVEEKIRQEGEWVLFPYVIHELIANGRIEIDYENRVFIDGSLQGRSGKKL